MLFTFFRHKPRGLNNSIIITIISVIENYATSMMVLILPLYLYAFFQSEFIVGQIASTSAFASVVAVLFLGFLLGRFSRKILYKLGIFLAILSIFIFFVISKVADAQVARILFAVSGVLTPAVLFLYIKDLTKPEDLPHTQGIFTAAVNFAWLTGPMFAGFLISFFGSNQDFLVEKIPLFSHLDPEYFQYTVPFIISLVLYLIALKVFALGKFVVRHDHLQEKKHSKKSDHRHHHDHFFNFIDHFMNTKRSLSFINLSFIAIWWVFVFTFLGILLEQNGVDPRLIGIILGLISLPNVLIEPFSGWFVKKLGGTTNTLILGYFIFFILIVAAFVLKDINIYLFAALIILSQIGVSITEPLQELQYYEGTDHDNEAKYYTVHKLGGQFFSLVTPVILGFFISRIGIDATFSTLPYLFIPLFILLFWIKKIERVNVKDLK